VAGIQRERSHFKRIMETAGLTAAFRGPVPIHARVLIVLWSCDAALAAAYVGSGFLLGGIPPLLNVTRDWSLAECFGYVKLGCASLLLLIAFRASRVPIFLSMAIILAVMVADDSMRLHERLGHGAVLTLALPDFANLKAQSLGELLVWGAMGAVLLPVFVIGFVKTRDEDRAIAARLAICVTLLLFFAIGMDILDEIVCTAMAGVPRCYPVMGMLEDGGEMAVQSLILAHVVALFMASRARKGTVPVTAAPAE
jgi:hypothetical protein